MYNLDDNLQEKDFLALAAYFSEEEGTCLLHSGGHYESARKSFLCLFPYEKVSIEYPTLSHSLFDSPPKTYSIGDNPWNHLAQLIGTVEKTDSYPEWVGYLGYGMGAFSDEDKTLQYMSCGYPDAYFQRSALVFIYDIKTKQLKAKTYQKDIARLNERYVNVINSVKKPLLWKRFCDEVLKKPTEKISKTSTSTVIRSLNTLEQYTQKVIKAKKLIYNGDIYQVNLSQKIAIHSDVKPFQIFSHLNTINPAPFSAFLSISPRHSIVSSSPERFLKSEDGQLETRPIKGTAARSKDEKQDQKNRENLLSSEKEKSELLMITDLMRNDLGKVSIGGSVVTEKIWSLESYTNVHHMLSVITSRVKPELEPLEIIRACFPGGSITGCPKLRAMEIITEIEEEARGIYTGSIGYIAGNGDFDFNIAIRTMNFIDNIVTAQVGGAVVTDSIPEMEYEETLHKGKSIFTALSVTKSE